MSPLQHVDFSYVGVFSRYLPSIHWLGWMPQPDVKTRGTLDILQSCIISISFCTTTSLHLNIPDERYGDWRRRWTRFAWMTVNTLAPEVFMCIAMTQYLEAKMVLRKIDEYCDKYNEYNPRWDTVQAMYFNMGGWKYTLHKPYRSRRGSHSTYVVSRQLKMKHLEAIVRKGLLIQVTKDSATIQGYAKSDRLGKTVALAQALWLLVQTFARIAQHLPTSPLEITAIAYVSCTFFSWLLWLPKPQDIGFSNEVTNPACQGVFLESCAKPGRHRRNSTGSRKLEGVKNQLPNIRRKHSWAELTIIGLTWFFTAALFGGMHLFAWNYEFPTHVEQIVWRTSSILIMALPPTFYLCVFILPSSRSVDFVGVVLATIYVLARSYNSFEVFFSLRRTPELLYQTVQWTDVLPHF